MSAALALLAPVASSRPRSGEVDIFMGVQLNYRDIFFNNRAYDFLVNLTPGVRWEFGRRWTAAAQVLVPVWNQYGPRYGRVRLNVATLSRQFGFLGRWRMKVSGGWFGYERYGLDIKNMVAVTPWLAVTAQLGLTGYCSMATGWQASVPGRVTALAGPEVFLRRWNTQLSVRGGRFVFGDWGVAAEAMRHFRHVTVSVYATYSHQWKENAGFKIIAMLPPWRRSRRRVRIRPASSFRLTYSMEAESRSAYMYITDPEQNEREGWFDRDLLPWGPDSAVCDFTYGGDVRTDSVRTDSIHPAGK